MFIKNTRLSYFTWSISFFVLFLTTTYLYTGYAIHNTVTNQLTLELEKKVAPEIKSSTYLKDTQIRLIEQINLDLARVDLTALLVPARQIKLKLDNIYNLEQSAEIKSSSNLPIFITLDKQKVGFMFEFSYQTVWLNIILAALFMAFFVTFAIYRLPKPVDSQTKDLLTRFSLLTQSSEQAFQCAESYQSMSVIQQKVFEFILNHNASGLSVIELLSLASQPNVANWNAFKFAWFCQAIKLNPPDLAEAFNVADSNNCIQFDPTNSKLTIHGIAINLSKTPFLYYLWYAKQRIESDGWILNPATNLPSKALAHSLIELMETYNGHAKAINDLRSSGLKAKTIDQNRNKIKLELTAHLGEELAEHYLFESRRDSKTQRYWYRLNCAEKEIKII